MVLNNNNIFCRVFSIVISLPMLDYDPVENYRLLVQKNYSNLKTKISTNLYRMGSTNSAYLLFIYFFISYLKPYLMSILQ